MTEPDSNLTSKELDLTCLIVRLEQIKSEGYDNGHWLLARVLDYDLPRVKASLPSEALSAITAAMETYTPDEISLLNDIMDAIRNYKWVPLSLRHRAARAALSIIKSEVRTPSK